MTGSELNRLGANVVDVPDHGVASARVIVTLVGMFSSLSASWQLTEGLV